MERCTYYKVWMLKTKRRSTSKMLTKETFCRVWPVLGKKVPQCHFVCHKTLNGLGLNTGLCSERPATNCLRHDMKEHLRNVTPTN